jgi:hypothetical protein
VDVAVHVVDDAVRAAVICHTSRAGDFLSIFALVREIEVHAPRYIAAELLPT